MPRREKKKKGGWRKEKRSAWFFSFDRMVVQLSYGFRGEKRGKKALFCYHPYIIISTQVFQKKRGGGGEKKKFQNFLCLL